MSRPPRPGQIAARGGLAAVAALFALLGAVASARADGGGGIEGQASLSIAVGTASEGGLFGHLWGGAGVHWVGGPADGGFLLAGVEADLRGSEEVREAPRGMRDFSPAPEPRDLSEVWLGARAGVGWFGDWKMAPQAALYAIAGMRVSGPEEAPRLRVGVGASVPAAIRLAYLGIPTMIETGVDASGSAEPVRGFVRLGWNL